MIFNSTKSPKCFYMLKKIVLVTVLVAGVVFSSAYFFHFRYLLPMSEQKASQEETLRILHERTGIIFPECSRVIFETDGRPLDGTQGFYYWAIFVDKPLSLPGMLRFISDDRKKIANTTEGVEEMIWPYKIKDPIRVDFHSWSHQEFDIRISAIKGRYGVYLSIQTFQRDKREKRQK